MSVPRNYAIRPLLNQTATDLDQLGEHATRYFAICLKAGADPSALMLIAGAISNIVMAEAAIDILKDFALGKSLDRVLDALDPKGKPE